MNVSENKLIRELKLCMLSKSMDDEYHYYKFYKELESIVIKDISKTQGRFIHFDNYFTYDILTGLILIGNDGEKIKVNFHNKYKVKMDILQRIFHYYLKDVFDIEHKSVFEYF